MSDISKEELKKEIAAILKDADLGSITSKKVRQDIEKKLDIDLSDRRKEVDELVMENIDKGKSKKNGKVYDEEEEEDDDDENDDDEDEEEEEEEVKKPKRATSAKKPPAKRYKSGSASSEESDDASDGGDDEYSPKKKTAKKPAGKRGRKKKGGSDDDSDEDWGKKKKKAAGAKNAGGAKRSSGYTKPVNLSPELAAIVGENQMPRHEVVKRIWALIKERNLYDPKNKQFAICDDELFKVIGVKRFRTFGMMKFLKNHFRD